MSAAIPCTSCVIGCCRAYWVPLTGFDLWRLVRAQALPPAEVAAPMVQEKETPAGFLLAAEGPLHHLVLHKRGGLLPGHACSFLVEFPNGHSRCGVYRDRPDACRLYPFETEGRRMGLRARTVCPPGGWTAEHLADPAWRALGIEVDRQLLAYYEVVHRWNVWLRATGPREPVPFTLYAAYLLEAYDRISRAPADGAEPLPPMPDARALPGFELLLTEGERWLRHHVAVRRAVDAIFPLLEPLPWIWESVTLGSAAADGGHIPAGA